MDRFQKWRLILGKKADQGGEVSLSSEMKGMDEVLEALCESERKWHTSG